MNSPHGDAFDEAASRLSDYQSRLRDSNQALQDISALVVESTSEDGTVTVTVDADGLMLGLSLAPEVSGRPSDQIANRIMHAYNTAQRESAARASQLIRASVDGAQSLADKYQWRVDVGQAGGTASAQDDGDQLDDDEDFGQASLYRA